MHKVPLFTFNCKHGVHGVQYRYRNSLRGIESLSGELTISKMFYLLSEKRSTYEGKRANSYREYHFRRASFSGKQTKVTTFVSLVNRVVNSPGVSNPRSHMRQCTCVKVINLLVPPFVDWSTD